ncbi:hypothetical protein SAMN05660653_01976 [Desulfonatronum thiosulfatophilum]|uniref:Uncharacterized protein n=1 Tax=Desulfonatronum thiosulfatophilum TaxID=617002 RepID=A0A1G6D728_9BACT|nr:hypothetical protein [Desulfonatronum thiosulfatophilum]SDB40966.1 hypothetical protein SAMN05660653_01976 [Desulfonatronum thiosulfatophilum]
MSEMNEQEEQKKAIFETLSGRAKTYVEKIGYEKWDPFQKPNDPLDLRKFTTDKTARAMAMQFLQQREEEHYSNVYAKAVLDMCMGLMDNDERYLAMYEFARWYQSQTQHHVDVQDQRTFRRD